MAHALTETEYRGSVTFEDKPAGKSEPLRDNLSTVQLAALAWAGIRFTDRGLPFRLIKEGGVAGGISSQRQEVISLDEIFQIERDFLARPKTPYENIERPQGEIVDAQIEAEHSRAAAECQRIFKAVQESVGKISALESSLEAARQAAASAAADARINDKPEPKGPGKAAAIETEIINEMAICDALTAKHATAVQRERSLRLPALNKRWFGTTAGIDRLKNQIDDLEKKLAAARAEFEQSLPAVTPFPRGSRSIELESNRRVLVHVLKVISNDPEFAFFENADDVIADPLKPIDRVALAGLLRKWRSGVSPTRKELEYDNRLPVKIYPRLVVTFTDSKTGQILASDIVHCSLEPHVKSELIEAGSTVVTRDLKDHVIAKVADLERSLGETPDEKSIGEYTGSLLDWSHIPSAIERGRI